MTLKYIYHTYGDKRTYSPMCTYKPVTSVPYTMWWGLGEEGYIRFKSRLGDFKRGYVYSGDDNFNNVRRFRQPNVKLRSYRNIYARDHMGLPRLKLLSNEATIYNRCINNKYVYRRWHGYSKKKHLEFYGNFGKHVQWWDGAAVYKWNGLIHRDGAPAVIHKSGEVEYWSYGTRIL